jgi:hypothetical protein
MLLNRIRTFLGLPDPDPLVRDTDPDPDQNVTDPDHLYFVHDC